MRKDKKKSLRFIIVLVLMCLGIGYAYLTTNLSINGVTDIDANSWNIYWDNIQVTTGSVTGDQVTQAPTIDSNLTTVSFHVRLKEPGEFYEFTVDAVNAGTIDAMIETITKTTNIPTYLNYKVTYDSGAPIAVKQLLSANSTEKYKVRVEFRTDINPEDLPSSPQSLDLSLEVEYVQGDDGAIAIPNKSFSLACASESYYFVDGMTVSDWIQSDLYPGDIYGYYDTLDLCINAWGNNKGCSHKESYYYYYREQYSYYTYTDSLEECNSGLNCTTVYNSIYRGDCVYSGDFRNTYEECKAFNPDSDCPLINGKYATYVGHNFYTSLDECNELSNWTEYSSCTLLPTAYQYNGYNDYQVDSLEECLANHPSNTCITRTYEYYSPDERDVPNGHFNFSNYYVTFYGNYHEYNNTRNFAYDEVLENKTYDCYHGAECVSPESDILSGNGKTIKAKDIKENDLIVYYNFDTNRTEIGRVNKVYIHKDATNLIRYEFEDNTYLEATDYHPVYTKEGWKSYTNRNGYPKPVIGDLVKTNKGYKRITKITPYSGKEDYYDFQVISRDGKVINNYYANGTLVQGSY